MGARQPDPLPARNLPESLVALARLGDESLVIALFQNDTVSPPSKALPGDGRGLLPHEDLTPVVCNSSEVSQVVLGLIMNAAECHRRRAAGLRGPAGVIAVSTRRCG